MNGLSSVTEGKPSSSYRMAFCVELLTGFCTEMTLVHLTSELVMELLCTLRMTQI